MPHCGANAATRRGDPPNINGIQHTDVCMYVSVVNSFGGNSIGQQVFNN